MTIRVKQTHARLHNEIDMFEPGERLAGIDVGSSLVKIVVIKEAPIGTRLLGAGVAEIQPPSPGQAEQTLTQRRVDAIQNALAQIKVPVKKVHTIISAPSVTVKNISLPAMPEAELRESVKWEMEQNITYPLAEASLDFLKSGETIRAGTKNFELEVVSAQKKDIEEHLTFYQSIPLNVTAVTIPTFCLWNIFQKSNQWKESDTIALLDVGARSTRIMVFHNTILRFSREIYYGENSLIEALQTASGMDLETARRTLVDFGVKENSAHYECLSQNLQTLVSEVDRSFGYYKAQFHIEKIDRLVVYGGLSRMVNFDRFLSEAVGVFAEMGNPFNGLLFEAKAFENFAEFSPYFAQAIGAALASGSAKRLNLLPWELRQQRTFDLKKLLIKTVPAVTAVAMLVGYAHITRTEKQLSKEQQEKEQIIKNWDAHIALVRKQEFLDSIRTTQDTWLTMLHGISISIPEDVWLHTCEFNTRTKRIQLSGVGQTNILVIEFVRNLEGLPQVASVQIQSTQEKDGGDDTSQIYFTITLVTQ